MGNVYLMEIQAKSASLRENMENFKIEMCPNKVILKNILLNDNDVPITSWITVT